MTPPPPFIGWSLLLCSSSRLHLRVHDKKVAILGLSSLIGLPQEVLPPSLRGIMLQLVQFALKFLYLIVEQKKGSVPPIFALNSSS